jgi:hypothetical protein
MVYIWNNMCYLVKLYKSNWNIYICWLSIRAINTELIVLTHYCMSNLWKMAVFIEKPSVARSNCYETIQKGFHTVQTWHKCDHRHCYGILNLHFLLPLQRWNISQWLKIHLFALIFPSTVISKCYSFSKYWDRVKAFTVLVTRYLKVNLRPFLASRESKKILEMRGSTAPGWRRKSDHF